MIDILKQHDDYIDIPQITEAIKKYKCLMTYSLLTQVDKMFDAYILFFKLSLE